MFGVFVDLSSKRIVYAEMIYIEVLEELAGKSNNIKTYKEISKNEMQSIVNELQGKYQDFEIFSPDLIPNHIVH